MKRAKLMKLVEKLNSLEIVFRLPIEPDNIAETYDLRVKCRQDRCMFFDYNNQECSLKALYRAKSCKDCIKKYLEDDTKI